MRDNRITQLATFDEIAKYMPRWKPFFVMRTYGAYAVYVFGKRIYSKGFGK